MTTPYFYIIKHIPSGKKYAGCRFAAGCNPSELLKEGGYQTSSGKIHKLIKEDGLKSFEIVSIVTHCNVVEYESNFLQENGCAQSNDWLNFHNNDTLFPPFNSDKFKERMMDKYGVENASHLQEVRDKISETNKRWVIDNPDKKEEQRRKQLEHYKNNPEMCKARGWKVAENKRKNGTTGKGLKKKHTNNGLTGTWERSKSFCEAISERQKKTRFL